MLKSVPACRSVLRLLAATVLLASTVTAQNVPVAELPQGAFTLPLNQQPPLTDKVVEGKLPNGMRYYIRENKEPRQRAEVRLVVDAGSILEQDNQLGLAHVLEHMAFNGTAHFPRQDIVHFMESIGMKLGSDLNASTSFDETIYMLQVPTDKPEPLGTALQIMDDWAHAMTLDSGEVDMERGVVAEEWRLGQGAGNRVRNQQLPVVLKDSRYAVRLPIGTLDSIQHFDQKVLRQFFQDWYRPELMAVVAVGDFDRVEVEKMIKQHFAAAPANKSSKPRQRYNVPPHNDTLYSIVTDPELTGTSVALMKLLPPITDWTAGGYRQRMVEGFYNAMLSQRFQDMARQPEAPFLAAASGRGNLVRTTGVYQLAAAVQETGVKRGLEALLVEAERVKRFGFSQAEFDRIKTSRHRGVEQMWASRNNLTSGGLAGELVRHYLTGETVTGTEYEVALSLRFLNTITLDEVNQIGKSWTSEGNRVVTVTMPKKDNLIAPTEAELKAVLANAARADIKPLEEKSNDAPLVSSVPAASKVQQTRVLAGNITEWTLGNGVKVVVKPTDYKQDEIVFNSVRAGGSSLASDADFVPADSATAAIASGGLGAFNAIELQRKLTGKVARVSPYISDYVEGFQGGGSLADVETLLQLIYLGFTAPRADPAMFKVVQTQLTTALQNRLANPSAVYSDTIGRLLYQNHPRKQPPSLELLAKMDLDKSLTFYQQRFSDANGFTFIFAGNIDLKTFQPLVETWLGGLPGSGRQTNWKDVGIRLAQGTHDEIVRKGKEPKANTRIIYTGTYDALDPVVRLNLNATTDILQDRLREVLREKLGGTYGVSVSQQNFIRPDKAYAINIEFGSAPERVDELLNAVYAELDKFKQDGPSATELANARAAMLRSHETGLRQNGTWLAQLVFSYTNDTGKGAEDFINYPQNLDKVNAASVRESFGRFFNNSNRQRVSLLPE